MNDEITAEEFKKYFDNEKIENTENRKDKENVKNTKNTKDKENTENVKIDKVRDHCHFTGKYRGAACISCNTQMKKPKFIPVIFHNLQNYDSHLFIKNLGVSEGEINCIPYTEEKYISFTKEIIVGKFEKTNIITEKQLQSKSKENIIECEELPSTSKDTSGTKYKIKEIVEVKKTNYIY